jgi:hypothetical protein
VHWSVYAEAAKAADDLLLDVFSLRSTHKDDRNITTRAGFESVLRSVTRRLLLVARPADEQALRTCLQALDNNWRGLSPSARDEAIDRAAQALGGVPRVIAVPVTQALSNAGREVVTRAKDTARGFYDLPIAGAFDLVDQRVIEHAARSQANYIRDEYGKRVAAASERAREVVASGLADGLDARDIGRRLAPEMAALSVRRSESYYQMVASVFAGRARSWGLLSSFEHAGLGEYTVSCVLDAASCNACRLMAEENFSVLAAAERYRRASASDDPEAVVRLQPFLGTATNDDGEQAVYYRRGDERRAVARVVESAVGQDDVRGRFDRRMTRGAMETAGISMPPFHPHCRCCPVPG